MKNIVIIGNGIAGITAARHIRKMSDHKITVISAETDHFFSRTALMYIYMGHMKYEHTKPYEDRFWEKNRIDLVRDYVQNVDTKNKSLELEKGNPISYDILIIATGSVPNKFGWPGQDLIGVQGLYSYQDLENMEKYTEGINRAVIVGGGLIGIEMAEMLLSRKIPVTFLVREKSFWNNVLPREESEMVNRQILRHHVDLHLNSELKEIRSDEYGRARSVVTKHNLEIPCQFVGLTAGVTPNISFLKDSGIETDRGVLINEYFETNIPDIYSIGDCAQHRNPLPGRKAVEQVWYTGRIQGESVAQTICDNRTAYQPGIWFNSAKFMDIEYQVYGDVPNQFEDEKDHIYWEHKNGQKSIRIVYDKKEKYVTGFNLMGIRYRHEFCDHWIKNKSKIWEIMKNLKRANFDPELYDEYEEEVLKIYNEKHPEHPVIAVGKRGVFAGFFK